MSTVPVILVDGNDLTDWLQDKSMSVKRNNLDATFIDHDGLLTAIPALGDVVELDEPAWTGVLNSITSTGYRGNVPFYKIHAQNEDALPDAGAAPFALADTGTRYSSPAGFKGLEVIRILEDAVEEVRARCTIFKEGVTWGMEIDLTSVVEGYTAETFTVMEMTVDWPTNDGATYTLDLGLGVYDDATTGGSDGGPLDPPTLEDEIADIARENCCDEEGGPYAGGDSIPLEVLTGGACDTPSPYHIKRQDDGNGNYTEDQTSISGDAKVASAVYNNSAYTDASFPCFLGGGSWKGYYDQEVWLEFTAPADDPTEYLGVSLEIDCSAVASTTYSPGYTVRLAQGAAASSRYGEGVVVAAGPLSGTTTVYVPRSFIDWGGTNCIVLHPEWLCERPAQFCNQSGYFGNPEADGRANSGAIYAFGFSDICVFKMETQTGLAVDVPGVGDVDGENVTFGLIRWATTGEVLSTINGIPVASSEMLLDTGAGEVIFSHPPPADSVVLFTYQATA